MGIFDKIFKGKKDKESKLSKVLPPKPVAIKPERFEKELPQRSAGPHTSPKPDLNTEEGLEKIKAELTADVAELSSKDSQLELRRQDLQNKISGATTELENLRKKIISDSIIDSSISQGISEHEKTRDQLKSAIEQAKLRRERYQAELKTLLQHMASSKSESKEEMQKLLSRKQKIQTEIDNLETSIDALNKKVDNLSVKVAYERSQLDEEKKERDGIKGEISTLEVTKMYLDQQVTEQKGLIDELHKQADDLVNKVAQKKKVEGGITSLKRQRSYLEKQIKELEAKQANLHAGITELEYKLKTERTEDKKIQNEVITLTNKKRLMNEEIQGLKGKHDELIDKISTKK